MLTATAVDRRGRVVRDLRENELRVLEDGRLQRLVHFDTAQQQPARILLLVDTSGSMASGEKTASTRMALVQLLAMLAPEDELALVGFDKEYREWVPATRDHARILESFDKLTHFGSTALHDALDRAARDRRADRRRRHVEPRHGRRSDRALAGARRADLRRVGAVAAR